MKALRKFKANFHSFEDVLLFIRIVLLIAVLPLLIRLLTLPQLMNVLTRRSSRLRVHWNKEDYREKIVSFTDSILSRGFWIFRNTCLKRSLVLYHFLHPVVADISICFGVRLQKDFPGQDREKGFEGHAWLLRNGEIFLEMNRDIPKTYTVTYCFPEEKNAQGKLE